MCPILCPKPLKHWCLKFYSSCCNLWKESIKFVCGWKKSDVTPFVIINIFISNLITHFLSVAVTDYKNIYFVIK